MLTVYPHEMRSSLSLEDATALTEYENRLKEAQNSYHATRSEWYFGTGMLGPDAAYQDFLKAVNEATNQFVNGCVLTSDFNRKPNHDHPPC